MDDLLEDLKKDYADDHVVLAILDLAIKWRNELDGWHLVPEDSHWPGKPKSRERYSTLGPE